MFLALALASACPAGQLTPEQAREDIELAISAAEAGLPDLYWRQSAEDWARRKAVARAEAARATNEEELFRALSPLLRGIGEGHLSVARSEGMHGRYRETARLFPLDLFWSENGAFVTAGYGDAADIPPGTRLTALNGAAAWSMLAEMMQVSAHDGNIRTGVMRDRAGRGYAAAPDGDLLRINAPPEGLMTRWEKASPVYNGRLAVLAGGYTFSGGAELASMLRATDRGLFVGEEVGGTHGGNTSGYKWELTLPNSGMEIGIPLLAFRFVWPEPDPNHGAMPHCFVPPRMGEVRVTKDAAYDVAVRALGKAWTVPAASAC